jgi:hypothetical protein
MLVTPTYWQATYYMLRIDACHAYLLAGYLLFITNYYFLRFDTCHLTCVLAGYLLFITNYSFLRIDT